MLGFLARDPDSKRFSISGMKIIYKPWWLLGQRIKSLPGLSEFIQRLKKAKQ
jgi:hypothetical protein